MDTIKISSLEINGHINRLINKTFSILPTYEEEGYSDNLISKINNVILQIEGFFNLIKYKEENRIEILSLLRGINENSNHKDIKYCVLSSCTLLSDIKVGD